MLAVSKILKIESKSQHKKQSTVKMRKLSGYCAKFTQVDFKKSQVGFLKKLLAVQFHLGQDFLAGILVHLDAEEYQDYKADSSQ